MRGINVGGKNIIPMGDLRQILVSLGYTNVRTYIQSGNCVFQTASGGAQSISTEISDAVQKRFGFAPRVMTLTSEALSAAIAANPYKENTDHSRTLLFFLAEPAETADFDAIDSLREGNEAFEMSSRVFYLSAPDGIGRSKLAQNVERHLKVPTTARNLRTALKIQEIASQIPA